MSWIATVDEDRAGDELTRLYGQMVDPRYGRVDNILRIHSLHPAGLKAHFLLYREVMKSTPTLPKVDREMIALVVSRINECHY
jgi:alkylhydroperoxidase family enzyme